MSFHAIFLAMVIKVVSGTPQSPEQMDTHAQLRSRFRQKAGLLPGRVRYTGKQSKQAEVSDRQEAEAGSIDQTGSYTKQTMTVAKTLCRAGTRTVRCNELATGL